MSIGLEIILCIIVFLIGGFIGMFISTLYTKKRLLKKPAMSRQTLAQLMSMMGHKPSAPQLNHMMKTINHSRNKLNK